MVNAKSIVGNGVPFVVTCTVFVKLIEVFGLLALDVSSADTGTVTRLNAIAEARAIEKIRFNFLIFILFMSSHSV
jgi:hypothetical protein